MVDLRLDVLPAVVAQRIDVDLVVEVADVAHDRLVFHAAHVLVGDDVVVAGGGDENVGLVAGFFHGHHAVAFHRRLQGADGVDLGDPHFGAQRPQRLGRALAHVAVAADDGDLAGDHHVGGALDAVEERFAAAVEVVELGLGDRVVDVDRRKAQFAALLHLVEAMHAGGGLFGDAADRRDAPRIPGGVALELRAHPGEEHLFFEGRGVVEHARVALGLGAQVQQERGVAPVVEDHVGMAAVGPLEDAVGVVPVFFQRLAFLGEDGDAFGGDGRGGVILGGEDVARGPAHLSAQRHQRLDEHGGLDGHVQAAGDAGAGQGLLLGVFAAQRHEGGHLALGDADLLAAPFGQRKIGDDVLGNGCGLVHRNAPIRERGRADAQLTCVFRPAGEDG